MEKAVQLRTRYTKQIGILYTDEIFFLYLPHTYFIVAFFNLFYHGISSFILPLFYCL